MAIIGKTLSSHRMMQLIKTLKSRGPEGAALLIRNNVQLGFTRLAINDISKNGMQPMTSGELSWICNGEVYNYKKLAKRHNIELKSGSDCEIIGPLIEKIGTKQFFRSLDGVFAMVIATPTKVIVGRDPYGIRPLFIGYSANLISFASEMKALPDCDIVMVFPPGNYMEIDLKTMSSTFVQYHFIPFIKSTDYSNVSKAHSGILRGLLSAVAKRLMTDRPMAALLSGGLDSSLIAGIVQLNLKLLGCSPLKTFSIGFEGSEDLRCARLVANHIKSDHTEIVMTPDDFFNAIPSVIRDIESFDITTVRASVGNWLLGREIKKRTNCKVVFNGDGSDELFGGYKYFHRCQTDEDFESEIEHLLENINTFDVLRSDRCISSHGLEPRTPFLDKEFVALVRSIPTEYLRPTNNCEKSILRAAFSVTDLLPPEILWRKKEAFSDGVSGSVSWYEICKQKAEELYGVWDETLYTYLPPKTAEAFYYRTLFEEYYPGKSSVIPYFWMPKWCPETDDPSARTLKMD